MDILMECKFDHKIFAEKGYIFKPFIPTVGSVCTLLKRQSDGGLEFEEVEVFDIYGQLYVFRPGDWKELTDVPSLEEIQEMIESTELVEI